MAYSTFGGDSLPLHAPMPNSFNLLQRHSPVVEHNVSYARSGALQRLQLVPTGLDILAPTNSQDRQDHQGDHYPHRQNLYSQTKRMPLNASSLLHGSQPFLRPHSAQPNQYPYNMTMSQYRHMEQHLAGKDGRGLKGTLHLDQKLPFHQPPRLIHDDPSVHRSPDKHGDHKFHDHRVHTGPDMPLGAQINGDMDEDERFIRIADDALVATSTEFNLIVDQNIQDLLVRLRYVLSPHGNSIHSAENIHANKNGQLMIQQFYKDFSNLRNDIFDGSFKAAPRNRRPNTKNDWDFLLNKESPNATTENGDLHSPSGERKYPCDDCLRSFHRSSDLRRHVKQHFKIPANICAQCGKGFARKDALKRHLGTMTCKRNASKKLYRKNLDYLAS